MSDKEIPTGAQASTAEFAVLGSCFCSHEAIHYVVTSVDEEHFVEPKNRMLFKVLKRLYNTGVSIDLVTVEGHLTAHEKKYIATPMLVDLTEKVQTAANVRHYASLMRNHALVIQINKHYEKLRADPFNEEARKDLARLWDKLSNNGQSVVSLKDATLKYTDTVERRRSGKEFRIVTGYSTFDNAVNGFYGGNLVAVGARTSLGKTSLLINFALRFLRQGLRVLFVSAEMVSDEILDRMVSMDADIPISSLRRGILSGDQQQQMLRVIAQYHEQPMWFIEGGKMSLNRLRTAIEAVNPSVIFVDFIQRFVPPNPAMNRAAYFSDLVNELKAMALDRKMVVLVASQLNRDIEKDNKGKGREPQLSDFKESGGIEEAADIAILLQAKRPGKNEPPEGDVRRVVLHVCKHRNGPTGKINFMFKKSRTQFYEEEDELVPQAQQNGHHNGSEPEPDMWVR